MVRCETISVGWRLEKVHVSEALALLQRARRGEAPYSSTLLGEMLSSTQRTATWDPAVWSPADRFNACVASTGWAGRPVSDIWGAWL